MNHMTPNIPELRTALDAATNEGERLQALLALSKPLISNDPREALALATECSELAERLHDEHRMAEALRTMGTANNVLANYQQSQDQLERARTMYERLGDSAEVAKTTVSIGQVYEYVNE